MSVLVLNTYKPTGRPTLYKAEGQFHEDYLHAVKIVIISYEMRNWHGNYGLM